MTSDNPNVAREGSAADSPTIIMIHQTVFESWARDVFSFGTLIAVMWFNAAYCGGSAWIYAIMGVCWMLWIIARSSKMSADGRKTPDEAREWLDRKFPRKPS
jgi:hypothetical protein